MRWVTLYADAVIKPRDFSNPQWPRFHLHSRRPKKGDEDAGEDIKNSALSRNSGKRAEISESGDASRCPPPLHSVFFV